MSKTVTDLVAAIQALTVTPGVIAALILVGILLVGTILLVRGAIFR